MAEQSEENQSQEDKIKSLAKEFAEASIKWFSNYAALNKKAQQGNITADDFNKIDNDYNEQIEAIRKKEKLLLSESEDPKSQVKILEEEIKRISQLWRINNPEIMESAGNVKVFDEAFRKIYLSGAPQKNLTLPEGTNTPEAMLSALLQNNAGIAIGEHHTKNTASNFIINNMELLKNSGVDTIYLEIGTNSFNELKNSSIEELKAMLLEEEKNTTENKELIVKSYGNKQNIQNTDDLFISRIKLFLSAKQHGIDIVNIDQKDSARELSGELINSSIETRFSSTNYTWTENILKDRQTKTGGKYIVFGGFSHFGVFENSTGLVDEALGLPVIAFDNRNTDTETKILRGNNTKGADFYLPAGPCHIDLKLIAEALELKDTIKSIQSWLPQIFHGLVLGNHYEQLGNHKKQLEQQLKLECSDVSEATNKTSPPTPTTVAQQQCQSPSH